MNENKLPEEAKEALTLMNWIETNGGIRSNKFEKAKAYIKEYRTVSRTFLENLRAEKLKIKNRT